MENKPKWLWKNIITDKYQKHVTISTIDSTTESEDADERIVYMEDLEKRKQVYGICGECNEPGTGEKWCQPCNAKRFKDNFKNWTSGNKDIDEFIQQSQLNSVYYKKYLEWIPFEKFQDITYIAEGGFGKIYSAKWPEGHIEYWDIENQKWHRRCWDKYALKSLNNSSNISSDFLNEIKSHLQIHLNDVVPCYGITQNPNTKEYMMEIARGLLDIHIVEKVHKDFHSGNILESGGMFISDLGMCQPANKKPVKEEGIYGVLPYMAPEVLRGYQYTKAADIYSFGIIMNEFFSEEIPYGDTSHDEFLAVKICKGQRPKISEDVPKLLADLIVKCWDAEIENRPTAKELYQTLKKYYIERDNENSELYSQLKECNEIGKKKFESRSSKDKSKNIQTHPQAIYTSRLLNFKNLPKPYIPTSNYAIQSTLANPISECLDVQLSESELNEICQDGENNIE
ncbi:kinase-like protein [Rhizophagus irregularis]|uniref:Kinase-like protein n=1 Tax=Rhizophagus irregularis TaxID=588596 RepID=A0A2N0PCT6_9GLOM|nr:kinase-like protein [Rhizophagus irregularis]